MIPRARRPLAGILLLLASPLATPAARAARLPDWAKAIAEATPAVPEGVPKSRFRVLLSETRYGVEPDGTLKIRRRFATQALSVKTEEVDTGWFHFEDTAKVTASRAWHLPPEETAKRSRSTPLDITVGDSFLTGSKVRAVPVEGVRKGSLVFFEFEATEKPHFFSLSHAFYEGAPVTLARFEVETPPGWTVRWVWLRRRGPDPVLSGNTRAWELRDLPEPEEEPLGVPPAEEAPLLAVNVSPPQGTSLGPAAFADWTALSNWYDALAKGRREVTPPIEAASKKALASAGPGLFDRIRAAGMLVRDRVRYVSVELGIGGYQPRPASETMANLYGDCKDKGTLFQSVLAAGGLESYPVLVNLGHPETVPEDPPVWGFNHLVVAVPLPASAEIPESFAPGVVEAGDLGRLLIVDTTSDRTSIGSLPAGLAGQRALVVAGPRGRLVTLPTGSPAAHRIEHRIQAELLPDHILSLTWVSRRIGEPAAEARAEFAGSSKDRRQAVERRILHLWPDARLQDYAADYETPEGAFVETVTLRRASLPASGPDSKAEIFPGLADDVERVSLGRRKSAVDYRFPRTVRYEVSYRGLSPSAPLPTPQDQEGEGWSVKTSYAREGESLTATWEIRLSRTHFEPEAFPELRKFWSAVSLAGGGMVRLSE